MRLVTWNVLHRLHAVNWSEPAIAAWPDERIRIASIADWLVAASADVICLQEVSGDQLAVLRDVVPGDIHAFAYPRVPRLHASKQGTLVALRDPAEHLVTIVRAAGSSVVRAEAFASDPGKGFLAVALADGTLVVDTHVSYGEPHAAQCATLCEVAGSAPRAIVCGDFNADRATCAAGLGDALACAIPPARSLPTRPRTEPSAKAQDIDHVFVRGLAIRGAEVADSGGRSDHNPVGVELDPVTGTTATA